MREELRQLIKPQLPADWLNMSDKISTGDWEVFAYDPEGQLEHPITNFSAPIPGAQTYVKIRVEPGRFIAWLHFCIRDDRGPLTRGELIETANRLLNHPIVEQDNVLPTLPSAGDVAPEGEPRFQDLWLQIGRERVYAASATES
jgi:hypothetical protein